MSVSIDRGVAESAESGLPGARGGDSGGKPGVPVPLGYVVVTREVDHGLMCHEAGRAFVMSCLRRHEQGDWGALGGEDAAANDSALASGARILSSYPIPPQARGGAPSGPRPAAPSGDERLWVITEAADGSGVRAQTTVLYPSDY